MESVRLNGKDFDELLSGKDIQQLVKSMGQKINEEYKEKNPIVVAVLDGAFMFAADLVRQFSFEHQFRFVKLSSYQGMESSGEITHHLDLDVDIQNRNILIIEDIVDTGVTLHHYNKKLQSSSPNSIEICALLSKPNSLKHKDLHIKYCGKEIDDAFVIGYGLDWDYKGRHLPAIYQLRKD